MTVTGSINSHDATCGDGETVEVQFKGTPKWTHTFGSAGGIVTIATQTFTVAEGDAIDFVTGTGSAGDFYCDSTTWTPQIEYV